MSGGIIDGRTSSNKIGPEIILEFQKSIKQMQKFGTVGIQSVSGARNPNPFNLQSYLVSEINKINTQIIKGIKARLGQQLEFIQKEVQNGNIQANALSLEPVKQKTGSPYGQHSILSNTFRSVLSGHLYEEPQQALYQALETFKITQLENVKTMQQLMLKGGFQLSNGDLDFNKIEQEMSKFELAMKQFSMKYRIAYADMSRVGGKASRITNNIDEARQFLSKASAISALDTKSNLVETIAPGIEQLMNLFGKSVWELDEIMHSFAVSTSRTKITADELMKAMLHSGPTLNQAGMTLSDAALFNALAVQEGGLAGEELAKIATMIMTQLALASSQKVLEDYGVTSHETDAAGNQVTRDILAILTDMANLIQQQRIRENDLDRIFNSSAASVPTSQILAFIRAFNNIEMDRGMNFHSLKEQALAITNADIESVLSRSLATLDSKITRANVSKNLAIVEVLETMKPQLGLLTDKITDLSFNMGEFVGLFTHLVLEIKNALAESAATVGLGSLGRSKRFTEHDTKNESFQNLLATSDSSSSEGGSSLASLFTSLTGLLNSSDAKDLDTGKNTKGGTKSKATATLGKLAKTAGKILKPVAIALTAADIVSALYTPSQLTDEEKALRNIQNNMEAYRVGSKHDFLNAISLVPPRSNYKDNFPQDFAALVKYGLNDLFNLGSWLFGGDGNVKVGLIQSWQARNEYKDWMKAQYGNEAFTQLHNTGEYNGRKAEEYLNEFLHASGKYEEFAKAELELYQVRALQAREDALKVQSHKEQVEEFIRQTELGYLKNGEYSSFSVQQLREIMDYQLTELFEGFEQNELETILAGHKTYSTEYFNVFRERLQAEQNLVNEYLEGIKQSIKDEEEILRKLEESGKHIVSTSNGTQYYTSEYKQHQQKLEDLKKLTTLEGDFQKRKLELERDLKHLEREELLVQSDVQIREAHNRKSIQDLLGGLAMDRSSTEYIDYQRSTTSEMISSLKDSLNTLKSQDILDPSDELKQRIQYLEQTLLGAELTLKDLSIQRITGHRSGLQRFDAEQEVELLKSQVTLGGSDHPLLRQVRRAQGEDRISELERIMSVLSADLSHVTDPEVRDRYQKELLDLEKQSLRVQLGLLDEVKGQGGTFNLPEGFKAMSEFDYMVSKGTHSSYAVAAGDTNVNVILPNINNLSSPEQIKMFANQLGNLLAKTRLNSYRDMLAAVPFGYRSY